MQQAHGTCSFMADVSPVVGVGVGVGVTVGVAAGVAAGSVGVCVVLGVCGPC